MDKVNKNYLLCGNNAKSSEKLSYLLMKLMLWLPAEIMICMKHPEESYQHY